MTIRDLVRNALRMRPDRIVVGEVRGAETLDMLQAMNTGHEGSMVTVHANSPDDAVYRLETLASMSEVNIAFEAIRDQINNAVDAVVQLGRGEDGSRRVVEIAVVVSTRRERFRLKPLVRFEADPLGADRVVRGRWLSAALPAKVASRVIAAGQAIPAGVQVAADDGAGRENAMDEFTPVREVS